MIIMVDSPVESSWPRWTNHGTNISKCWGGLLLHTLTVAFGIDNRVGFTNVLTEILLNELNG